MRCEVASAVPSRTFYITNLQRQISSQKGAPATFQPQQLHRTKCSGMSLQICRSRFNFDSVARRLRTLFVLSCGSVALNLPAFLLDLMGWLIMFIMIRRKVLVMNSLAPD